MKKLLTFLTVFIFAYAGYSQVSKVNNNVSVEKPNPQDNKVAAPIEFGSSAFRTTKPEEDFFNKGVEKFDLKDYSGAIAEFTKAIELKDAKNAEAYYNRGVSKYQLKDNSGAIEDYAKAIEVNPAYAKAYYNRAIAKSNSEQKDSACSDFKKAEELGYTKASEVMKEYCK